MTDSAVAEPPAADTAPASELELDTTQEEGKAYVLEEFTYANSKVTLLGKMITKPDGSQHERRFFATEHFYTNKEGKWARDNYYDKAQLDELIMAGEDARRAYHDKSLRPKSK